MYWSRLGRREDSIHCIPCSDTCLQLKCLNFGIVSKILEVTPVLQQSNRQYRFLMLRLLHKKFHKQIEKINGSKNPEKIAKNYLKIYREFRKEFEGWFKSFSSNIVKEIEIILLGQHILYLAKSLKRDQNLIYEFLDKLNYSHNWSSLQTYFGITNYDAEFTVYDIAWE
jgi:hypothetical protein